MERVAVSEKGQILIPKKLREKYGIKPGSKNIVLEETAAGITIRVIDKAYIQSLVGKYKIPGVTMQDFMDLKQEDKLREDGKYERLFGIKKKG